MEVRLRHIVFIFCCVYVAEACLKNNEPDNGGGSNTGSTQSPVGGSRQPCTSQEASSKSCLNGGTCYVTVILGSRSVHCQCINDYEGDRCDVKTAPLAAGGSFEAGAIAGIIIGVIVLALLLGALIFFVIRKRQKDGRPKLDELAYEEDMPNKNQKPSNYAASRHAYNSNNSNVYNSNIDPAAPRNFSNFSTAGHSNPGYSSSSVSSNPYPLPFTISGNLDAVGSSARTGSTRKNNGPTAPESDERDAHSNSRPNSSSGGSFYHASGSLGQFKAPLAFHESGV